MNGVGNDEEHLGGAQHSGPSAATATNLTSSSVNLWPHAEHGWRRRQSTTAKHVTKLATKHEARALKERRAPAFLSALNEYHAQTLHDYSNMGVYGCYYQLNRCFGSRSQLRHEVPPRFTP